jgi:SAM-dependent methyltransferase
MDHYDRLWSSGWQTIQAVGPLTHSRYRLMLRELPVALPPGSRILDVGCGNGTFLGILGRRYPGIEAYGVEYSQTACDQAPPDLRSHILVGDILEVAHQLKPASFDIAICSEVLEHVDNPERVMTTICSLLKPGGQAVFTVPGNMRHWSSQDEVAGHRRRFEFADFQKLVESNGLRIRHHFGWGGPFAYVYNRVVSQAGPDRVMKSGRNPLVGLLARCLVWVFRIDDMFCAPTRFQLITSAMRST